MRRHEEDYVAAKLLAAPDPLRFEDRQFGIICSRLLQTPGRFRWRSLKLDVRQPGRFDVESYELEKSIWTEQDYEVMGWHDCRLWAMVANIDAFEFALDLDYIFKWIQPGPEETYFKFWLCPVTMVFENAHRVSIDIESEQGLIQIDHLHREGESKLEHGGLTEYVYRFECEEGEVSLRATGYKMYVRQPPRLTQRQYLDLKVRGGISVDKVVWLHNNSL